MQFIDYDLAILFFLVSFHLHTHIRLAICDLIQLHLHNARFIVALLLLLKRRH